MDLNEEFFRISKSLLNSHIRFCVIGGIAMAFHSEPRFTKDIDFLLHPDDLAQTNNILKSLEYFESSEPWTFNNTDITLYRFAKTEAHEILIIDILLANSERHKEVILNSNLADSEHGEIPIANKLDLIWLKSIRNSDQDQVDISKLSND